MLNLDDLKFFDALADAPSMAAAARALGVTPPALSSRLRRIEAALQASLVLRGPRGLVLTDAGQRLVAEARVVLAQLQGIGVRVTRAVQSLEGPLLVAAPFGYGRRHVAPLLDAFCRDHPRVVPTLSLGEHPLRESAHADVVVHIGKLRDSRWVAHRLARNERWLCASPAFVRQHGPPRDPADLAGWRCLCLRENDEDLSFWELTRGRSAVVRVRVRAAMSTNDGEVLSQWAEQGQGVILRSQWDAQPRIAAGRLVRVLPEWRGVGADVFALQASRRGQTARAQAFVAYAKARLDRRAAD